MGMRERGFLLFTLRYVHKKKKKKKKKKKLEERERDLPVRSPFLLVFDR